MCRSLSIVLLSLMLLASVEMVGEEVSFEPAVSDSGSWNWEEVPEEPPDCWLDVEGTDAALRLRMEREAPRHRLVRDDDFRRSWAEDIHWAAVEATVPPSLVVAIAYRESSIRYGGPAGALGELGPLQISRHAIRKYRCDTGSRRGLLHCGTQHLRWCAEKCGDWRGAMSCYVTKGSKCRPTNARVQWIVSDRVGEAESLRQTLTDTATIE